MNRSNSITLHDYETGIIAHLADVTLLGQLPYDEDDLAALRRLLRPRFVDALPKALAAIERDAPFAFALYLVLEGVYHYESGDYWSRPAETLRLSTAQHKSAAGTLFRRVLRCAALPTFEDLDGHVHVSPILAHGGIPNYCLDDFFALLDRAHRHAAGVDVVTLLEGWKDDVPQTIDRPVRRFLLHSDVAEEFVARCLALWVEDDDPRSLDLPARVLERYDRWREANPARANGHTVRLGRPKLIYDPYGEGVAIVLPPVTYRADHAPERLTWRLVAERPETAGHPREERTWRRPRGEEVEFAPRSPAANVLNVAPAYTVTALADDQPLRSWTLSGPGALPLLAFDGLSGELLPDRQAAEKDAYWLSPGERHLVFPRQWTAEPHHTRKLAALPDPGGQWSDFAFETWRLEPDGRLDLLAPDGRRAAFRARNDPPPARPTLDGEPPLLAATPADPFALYTGRPPLLCIPPGRADHRPEKWRIDIAPAAGAHPPQRRAFSLAALPEHCVMEGGNVLLALDAPELLGPSPLGEFHIRLRGPYGRAADFPVRFAPALAFDDYPRLHLAADETPTTLGVRHSAELELSSVDHDVAFGPPVRDGTLVGRSLSAPAALPTVPLTLTGPQGQLSIELPVYRLRIARAEPERPEAFAWATMPLRIYPDALDAPHSALLRADLPRPPGAPPLCAGWRLVDDDGRIRRETPHRPTARHAQTRLLEWLDAYRAAGHAATLQLLISDGDGADSPIVVEVARLLPTLELGHVVSEWHTAPDGDRLSVLWEHGEPIRNRRLRLWPVDRPWVDDPLELVVPDDAVDHTHWTRPPGELLPGDYLAEMVVIDPWLPEPSARPDPGAPNTFPLRPGDLNGALDEALARSRRDELPAEDALAWVLYLARARPDAGADLARLNLTLRGHQASLSPGQLLHWADATSRTANQTGYSVAQRALFEDDRIAQLTGGDDDEWRAACLTHLPEGLDAAVYRDLLPLARGASRALCVAALCRAGDAAGYAALLADAAAGDIDEDAAAALLLPNAPAAADYLYGRGNATATALLAALLRRAPDDRYIAVGNELMTNVGRARVEVIRDPRRMLLDVCRADDAHQLTVKLWPEGASLTAIIYPQTGEIRFLSRPLYKCQFDAGCDFVFANVTELNRHYKSYHRIAPYKKERSDSLSLKLTYMEHRRMERD